MKKILLIVLTLLLSAVPAPGETIIVSSDHFALVYGTAAETMLFQTLIDGSDEDAALAAQQIKHPTITGLFLIHSIATTDLINVWGYAFSADWAFNSATAAGSNVKRIIRWQDETIEILDGYNFLEIIAPDDSPISITTEAGGFYGVAPDSNENVLYVPDPGRVISLSYDYDLVPVGSGSTWQGTIATWQGGLTSW